MPALPILVVALGLVGVAAGAVAAVAGFGIGSLLAPVLALETGTRLAVAAVPIPHLVGTRLLARVPEVLFHRIVGVSLIAVGILVAAGGMA